MYIIDNSLSVLSLSLAYALVGLNVYLTTKILNVTDLTCDGSVAIGGCAYGALVLYGVNPFAAFLFAGCAGMLAGFITSSFSTHVNIEPVLASIITLTALQTFIMKLCSLGNMRTAHSVKSALNELTMIDNMIVVAVVVTIICIFFYKLMHSEYGLAMRVYGDGKIISESLGINSKQIFSVGLGLGNCMSAIAGALIVQVTGVFSATMGNGSLVFGLAAVIIGEKLLSPKNMRGSILGCLIGSIIYKTLMELATFGSSESVGSEYNNIIAAVVLILLMALIQDSKKKGSLENI